MEKLKNILNKTQILWNDGYLPSRLHQYLHLAHRWLAVEKIYLQATPWHEFSYYNHFLVSQKKYCNREKILFSNVRFAQSIQDLLVNRETNPVGCSCYFYYQWLRYLGFIDLQGSHVVSTSDFLKACFSETQFLVHNIQPVSCNRRYVSWSYTSIALTF